MIKKLAAGGVGVIVFIGLIALKFGAFTGLGFLAEKAGAPDVGDCVVLSGSADNADVKTKKCGSDTLWKVVADDGKCDEIETSYTVTITGAKAVNLCLAEDVAVGECIEINPDDPKVMDKQVPCTTQPSASTVVAKVTKIDTTSADL